MEARKDAELMSILREADLVVPDGIGVDMGIQIQQRFACRSVWQAMTDAEPDGRPCGERGNLLFLWRRARSCGNGGKKNDEEIPRTEDCGRA